MSRQAEALKIASLADEGTNEVYDQRGCEIRELFLLSEVLT